MVFLYKTLVCFVLLFFTLSYLRLLEGKKLLKEFLLRHVYEIIFLVFLMLNWILNGKGWR